MELWRWIQVLCILPALQDFLDCRVHSSQCPDTHYSATQENPDGCCKKCAAGEKVVKDCSYGKNDRTICAPCEEGRFQPEPNGKKFCSGRCGKQFKANRELLKNCTNFNDQEYGHCYKDFYHNKITDSCSKCAKCRVGYGVLKACKNDSNTVCDKKKCRMGTYSDEESSTQKCTPCTACASNEEMIKNCTPFSNYECRKIINTPTTRIFTQSNTSNTRNEASPTSLLVNRPTDAGREEGPSWVVPFFIASMVLLVILFLAFVIGVTVWCHIQSRNRQQNIIVQAEDPEVVQRLTKLVDDVESVSLPANEDSYQRLTVPFPEGKTEGMRENGMMLRDVSHDIIEELASFLNPTSPPTNWRKVASTLDFPWNVISNLALSPTTATQQLLERWGTKRDATVYKLYEILKDIGRDDAAEVLERLLVQPVPSCPKSV